MPARFVAEATGAIWRGRSTRKNTIRREGEQGDFQFVGAAFVGDV
jgi:hypothetical protein